MAHFSTVIDRRSWASATSSLDQVSHVRRAKGIGPAHHPGWRLLAGLLGPPDAGAAAQARANSVRLGRTLSLSLLSVDAHFMRAHGPTTPRQLMAFTALNTVAVLFWRLVSALGGWRGAGLVRRSRRGSSCTHRCRRIRRRSRLRVRPGPCTRSSGCRLRAAGSGARGC